MSGSKKRISPSQQQTIIEYLEGNETFKTRKLSSTFTVDDYGKMWENLTDRLNADGSGPNKTVDKWKKALADWKSNCKSKWARIKKSLNATGGGEKGTEVLTPIEEKLLAVFGQELTDGIAGVAEYGLPMNNHSTDPMRKSHSVQNENETLAFSADMDSNSISISDITQPRTLSALSMDGSTTTFGEYFLEDSDSNMNISMSEQKRQIEIEAKDSLAKRQKRMSEGKQAQKNQLENTSALLEKLQESQNDVYKDISNSLSRQATATEDLVEQQKALVSLKREKNVVEKLKLATQRRTNDIMQSLVDVLSKKIA